MMNSRRWSNPTKIIVVSALAVIALALLVTFRQLITPTIVAFLLTFVLSYPLSWVQQRTGWARLTALVAVYILIVIVLVLASLLLLPRLDTLTSSLTTTLQDLVGALQGQTGGPLFTIGPYQLSVDTVFQNAGSLLQNILAAINLNPGSIARSVTTGVLSVVYVLVLNFWLLKDWHKLQRFLIELVPTDYQEEVWRLADELGQVWQAFLRGQLVLGFVVGLLVWICLVIVGVPNPLGLGIVAGLMELLPSIGPAVSGTIGTTIALLQGSNWLPVGNLTFAIVVGVIYAIIGQFESVYLIPRLVGGRVKLHPAVTFVGIIGGALTFGVLGILLAAPVIASSRVLLNYLVRKLNDQEPFAIEQNTQSALRIAGLIAGRKIEGVIFDLDGTISRVDLSPLDWASTRFNWLGRLVTQETRRNLTRHVLIAVEGFINLLVSQIMRLNLHRDLERLSPLFDRLRCYLPAERLVSDISVVDQETVELIRWLSLRYKLALVTPRTRKTTEGFLKLAGLENAFDAVVTRNDVRTLLPHAESLLKIATDLQLNPNQLIVVSDTDVNLRAGRATEMATAGVTSGLATGNSLRDADLVLKSPAELADWL